MSILSGEHSCWPKSLVVRSWRAQKDPAPTPSTWSGPTRIAQMWRPYRYICLRSYWSFDPRWPDHPMLRSIHSTLARLGETGAPLFVSSLFFCHAQEQIKPRVPALPVAPKGTQSNGLPFSGSWISLERRDRRWSTAHPSSPPWTLCGSRCDGRPISLSLWNR
jgi:hypothetical protein